MTGVQTCALPIFTLFLLLFASLNGSADVPVRKCVKWSAEHVNWHKRWTTASICCFLYQTQAHASTRKKKQLLAAKIKQLKEDLKEIVPKLQSFGSVLMTRVKEPPGPQFNKQDPVVFGMDVPSQDLVELLKRTPAGSDTKEPLKVISIVAFGGSGKTRLANQVYGQISEQFDRKIWVHMGLEIRNMNEVLDEDRKSVV